MDLIEVDLIPSRQIPTTAHSSTIADILSETTAISHTTDTFSDSEVISSRTTPTQNQIHQQIQQHNLTLLINS